MLSKIIERPLSNIICYHRFQSVTSAIEKGISDSGGWFAFAHTGSALCVRFIDFAIYLNLIYWRHLVRNGYRRFTLRHIKQLKNCSSTLIAVMVMVLLVLLVSLRRRWRLPQIASEKFHFLFFPLYTVAARCMCVCLCVRIQFETKQWTRIAIVNAVWQWGTRNTHIMHIICLLLSDFQTFLNSCEIESYLCFFESVLCTLPRPFLEHLMHNEQLRITSYRQGRGESKSLKNESLLRLPREGEYIRIQRFRFLGFVHGKIQICYNISWSTWYRGK